MRHPQDDVDLHAAKDELIFWLNELGPDGRGMLVKVASAVRTHGMDMAEAAAGPKVWKQTVDMMGRLAEMVVAIHEMELAK